MPELQSSAPLGEMSQRFLSMLMRQAQQIALCLGQMPLPGQDKPEVHLELARLLIDELEMIKEKTRGNLSSEESQALTSLLGELQLAFVQVANQQKNSSAPASEAAAPAAPAPDSTDSPADPEVSEPPASPSDEEKKRFSKSYG